MSAAAATTAGHWLESVSKLAKSVTYPYAQFLEKSSNMTSCPCATHTNRISTRLSEQAETEVVHKAKR